MNLKKSSYLIFFTGLIITLIVSYQTVTKGYYEISQNLLKPLMTPFYFAQDNIFIHWLLKVINEGWIFENNRLGYPFGSEYYDICRVDFFHLVMIKILSFICNGNIFFMNNLFFIVCSLLTFTSSYFVCKKIKCSNLQSLTISILFIFTSFYLIRFTQGHVEYCLNFQIPFFFLISYNIYIGNLNIINLKKYKFYLFVFYIIILVSLNIYYTFFGFSMILLAGILGWVNNKNKIIFLKSQIILLLMLFGIFLNYLPNQILINKYGKNNNYSLRRPLDLSEAESFTLPNLILPRQNHPIKKLDDISKKHYEKTIFFKTENVYGHLGLIGSIGFLCSLSLLFIGSSLKEKKDKDDRLNYLSSNNLLLFFVGLIGGFGYLFAFFIYPNIKSWNRISIFILFNSLLIFFILVEKFTKYIDKKINLKIKISLIYIFLLIFGLWEQIWNLENNLKRDLVKKVNGVNNSMNFYKSIEKELSKDSRVYVYKYLGTWEGGNYCGYGTYRHLFGFIFTDNLKWNIGGMMGRNADNYYRYLEDSKLIEDLIKIIKKIGFNGIVINRYCFPDNANEIIERINYCTNSTPSINHIDNNVAFYNFKNDKENIELSKDTLTKIAVENFYKNFEDTSNLLRIDFNKQENKKIKKITGLSNFETWGRWSNDNIQKNIKIELENDLPEHFLLRIKGFNLSYNSTNISNSIGKNNELKIIIGGKEFTIDINKWEFENSIYINIPNIKTNYIEFIAKSTNSQFINDTNKLSIGFEYLEIKNFKNYCLN